MSADRVRSVCAPRANGSSTNAAAAATRMMPRTAGRKSALTGRTPEARSGRPRSPAELPAKARELIGDILLDRDIGGTPLRGRPMPGSQQDADDQRSKDDADHRTHPYAQRNAVLGWFRQDAIAVARDEFVQDLLVRLARRQSGADHRSH